MTYGISATISLAKYFLQPSFYVLCTFYFSREVRRVTTLNNHCSSSLHLIPYLKYYMLLSMFIRYEKRGLSVSSIDTSKMRLNLQQVKHIFGKVQVQIKVFLTKNYRGGCVITENKTLDTHNNATL